MNLSNFYLEQAHKLHIAAVSLKQSADKIKASSNSMRKALGNEGKENAITI